MALQTEFQRYHGPLDDWEKQTIERLRKERAEAIAAMRSIEDRLREDPPDVGEKAEEWDDLPESAKQEARDAYIRGGMDDEMQHQVDSWQESLDEQLKEDDTWLQEKAKEWAAREGLTDEEGNPIEGPGIDPESLEHAVEWYHGQPHVDPTALVWTRDDPNQLGLFSAEELQANPALRWDTVKEDWQAWIQQEISAELERRGMDPPSYLSEAAEESLGESFDSLDDDDKFQIALRSGYEPESDSTTASFPTSWSKDILMGGDASEKAAATALAEARYVELAAERQLPAGYDTEASFQRMSEELWDGWKQSSTSPDGLTLQLAVSTELGGRAQDTPQMTAHKASVSETDLKAAQTYVRAVWDTNQYLMAESGVESLDLYRAIDLPKAMLDSTPNTTEKVAFFGEEKELTHLPNIAVTFNGAQSTTASVAVANGWSGVDRPAMDEPERVVLRIKTPTHAVVSLPIYGKNIQGEEEVVIGGLPVYGWDAWRKTAPQAAQRPIKGVLA